MAQMLSKKRDEHCGVSIELTLDLAGRAVGEEDVDTPYSRFVVKLLRHLLAGMEAKDKNVRYRVILLTVTMISGLGELE